VLTTVTTRKRLFSPTTYIFTLWMVGSSLVLVAVATIFMRNQVRPIRRLAAAANSFGKGRDVPHFRPAGAAEVRQAAQAFIEMRDRIKRQIEQRTEMLAGVSHDLRTPLTRMKLELAMLGDSAEIDELKADVEEMEKMVDGYLAFARGEGAAAPEPADISAVLEQVVASARKEGARIDLHTEEHLVLPVRLDAIRRCFTNLVLNAVRYGKHVQVRAGRRADAVEVLVDDDGPGIPADQREAVFRAFFRLDPSRNIETGGVGLGLTIARDVVRAHGGDILLDQSPLGGLRARLRLPL
jgi:two-component system osmolarity sensor histidine kinase EnvZ